MTNDDEAASADSAAETVVSSGYPRKRERTRKRLITAGMIVLARRGPDGATVGEIAGEAGVAPGTFYNHFPSLIDLVEAVVAELQAVVEIASSTLDSIDNDPPTRVVIGTMQLLDLVRADSASAAAFVSLLATTPTFRRRVRSVVQGTIESGRAAESFDVSDTTAAADAVLGSVVQWIRSDLARESGTVTAADRSQLVLRLLGTSKSEEERALKLALASTPA